MSIFSDQVIWITGASGALGGSISELLHARGATVVLSARNRDKLPTDGIRKESLVVDVTDGGAVEAAAKDIIARHGRINALVACTTSPIFGDFLELTDDDWFRMLDSKLIGAVRPARAVLPGMIERGEGRIVFLSGRGGTFPPPRHLPGGCANASLNLLASGLATAYSSKGVLVNAVAPGPVASPRMKEMQRSASASTRNALGIPAEPLDVAEAVAFLISPAAKHITGTTLHVDGGRQS